MIFKLLIRFVFCVSFTREQDICATIARQKSGVYAIKSKSAIICTPVSSQGRHRETSKIGMNGRTSAGPSEWTELEYFPSQVEQIISMSHRAVAR
jgi:hypothetical protein